MPVAFSFRLGSNKRKNWHNADLVILVPANTNEFYLFKTDHPVLYHDGKPKSGLGWKPGNVIKRNTYGISLDDQIMAQHKDRWGLITECRDSWFERS